MENKPSAQRRTLRGTVVSDRMMKTVVVKVSRKRWHTKYHRQYSTSATYKVHDEKNEYHKGDVVEFVETRPLSKEKRWRVTRKIVI